MIAWGGYGDDPNILETFGKLHELFNVGEVKELEGEGRKSKSERKKKISPFLCGNPNLDKSCPNANEIDRFRNIKKTPFGQLIYLGKGKERVVSKEWMSEKDYERLQMTEFW